MTCPLLFSVRFFFFLDQTQTSEIVNILISFSFQFCINCMFVYVFLLI